MLEEFSNILIDRVATVKDAMQKIEQYEEKILFVVDPDSRLIGSLTDGDIRRWILRNGDLNSPIEQACFKKTYYVYQDYDLDQVKGEILNRQIFHVPILDDEQKIIGFLLKDRLFDGQIKKKVRTPLTIPVVIMAGGKGTRLDPFTKILPKPLIPIGDKSILEIIIEKFLPYQVNHFYISINYKAKIIKSYFEELAPPYTITYIEEHQPLGTAGSLKALEGKISGAFLLTNCDILIDTDYNDVTHYHMANRNEITLIASVKHYHLPYGICEIDNGGILKSIKEKPEYSVLVNTGMYLMNTTTFDHIPPDKFFHVTHLIEEIQHHEGKIGVYPIGENSWIDIGEWTEYKKALEKIRV